MKKLLVALMLVITTVPMLGCGGTPKKDDPKADSKTDPKTDPKPEEKK